MKGVLWGLQLDLQEGRTRVCMRREGNQFSLGLTRTPQQKKQAAHLSTHKICLSASDLKHLRTYAHISNAFEKLLWCI